MRQYHTTHQVIILAILLLVSGPALAQNAARPAVEFTVGLARQNVHGRFGWYDSWHTRLRIGQGLDDIIITGNQTYFGGGVGIDYLPHPGTALFVELIILDGQSNYPDLSLLAVSAGTRITL